MKKLILFYTLLTSTHSYSYPLFYGCKDGQLIYTKNINYDDIFLRLLSDLKKDRSQKNSVLCRDAKDCLSDFDLALRLTSQSLSAAHNLFLENFNRIYKNAHENEIIKEIEKFDSQIKIQSAILACNETKENLNEDDFISRDGKKILTPYPFYSNYMYATGCFGVDARECNLIDKADTDRIIKESLIMETDPYTIMALSLMEGGPKEVGKLYLDPIGVMEAIGCTSKQVKNDSEDEDILDSFGTKYTVNSQVVKDSNLKNKIKLFFDTFEHQKEEGDNGYYCYDTRGREAPQIFKNKQSNSCCLELGFNTKQEGASDIISHALTYHYVNKVTKSNFRGRKEPEWKVQRFNGYTDLMGGAEGVQAWRSGVNYYETPAYGYQVMDFIINALMFNPYIASAVNRESKKINSKWQSLLCKDKEDGIYHIDSDSYFNKHKNSSRLSVVHEKFKKGVKFENLTLREQNVLLGEMNATALLNKKMRFNLSYGKQISLGEEVAKKLQITSIEGELFFKERVLTQEEWLDRIGKSGLTHKELEIIYTSETESREIFENLKHERRKINELRQAMVNQCLAPQPDQDCLQEIRDFFSPKTNRVEIKNEKLRVFANEAVKIEKEIESLDKKAERAFLAFAKNTKHFSDSKQKEMTKISKKIFGIEPLNEALERLKGNPNFLENKNKIIALHYSQSSGKQFDNEEAYQEYFKNIYPNRETLGESSNYPWRRFNEGEIRKLIKLYTN